MAKAAFIKTTVILVALACTTGLNAYARHHESSSTDSTTDKDLPDNFYQVHDYLYRGAKPGTEGLGKLKAMGVTVDIDLCQAGIERERKICQQLGITFISLPTDHDGPTNEQIIAFLTAVKKCKQSNDHQIAFLHCALGRHRTGSLIGVYRLIEDGWTLTQAHEEMLKYGSHDDPEDLSQILDNYRHATKALPVGNTTVGNTAVGHEQLGNGPVANH